MDTPPTWWVYEQLWKLIHPIIKLTCQNKFTDGYYADSIESALKEINKQVKTIVLDETGEELDGKGLMLKCFSPKNPIIDLGNLNTKSGRDIQEGYMHIFAVTMQGIRNPKAHDNIIIDRKNTIHFIFLASLLMNKLNEVTGV